MKAKFLEFLDAIAFAVAVLTAISAPILIVLYVLAESERGPIRWSEGAFRLLWSLGGFCVAFACPVARSLAPRRFTFSFEIIDAKSVPRRERSSFGPRPRRPAEFGDYSG